MDGDERDDQLGRVAERRVEEAADPGPGVLGRVLGRLADQPRERDERRRGEDELDRLVEVGEVVERDRERPERRPAKRMRRTTSRTLPGPLATPSPAGDDLPATRFGPHVKSCAALPDLATIRA